jgi:hypothetical protein
VFLYTYIHTDVNQILEKKLKIEHHEHQFKIGNELRFFEMVSRSCSTRGPRHVAVVHNFVIGHKKEKMTEL